MSSTMSSDDDTVFTLSFPEDPSGDNDDDILDPVATEKEITAYEESSARVKEELQEYRRRCAGETSVST